MKRTNIAFFAGACLAVLGAAAFLGADSLATSWQAIGDGARAGTTDPSLRHTYQVVGLAGLYFGATLVAIAAWHWLAAELAGHHPRAAVPT